MDGFTYTDIFDTKGIEYLIIIAFLILVIPLWVYINRPVKVRKKAYEALGALSERLLRIPQGLYFSKYHSWAFLEKSGVAKVGADDLLLHVTGDVRLQSLIPEGSLVKKGEPIARIIRNGNKLMIASPITGKLTDVNESLLKDEGAINRDPYNNGWICMIKPDNWHQETSEYFLGNDAANWIKKELDEIKEFILNAVNTTSTNRSSLVLQEGGELTDHPLAEMPDEIWDEFQKKFLKIS